MALYHHAFKLSERGMRILRFPLLRLIIALSIFALGSALGAVISGFLPQLFGILHFEDWLERLLNMLFQCGFAILGYWLFVSLFDGRPTKELSTGFVKFSFMGISIGVIFISLIMGILTLLGYYRIEGLNTDQAILNIFYMSVVAGITEEILLRGYFFRIVEAGLGTWWSVAISALLFGFLHAWNPNASIISSVSIALTAGVVLALLFVITRNLWLVIGMHFAWNFTLGGIYGAPVSGGAAKGYFNGILDGPVLLTGGEFGPEASVITVAVFAILGVYLVFRTIKSKQVIQPFWRRSS